MLVSKDAEMRQLGRMALLSTMSSLDETTVVFLRLNSNTYPSIRLGLEKFLRKPRSVKNLLELIKLFKENKFSFKAYWNLKYIQHEYREVKKLKSFFEEVDLINENLDEKNAIIVSRELDKP